MKNQDFSGRPNSDTLSQEYRGQITDTATQDRALWNYTVKPGTQKYRAKEPLQIERY